MIPTTRALVAPLPADRDHLEAEANVARARLARTLEALDRRRHDLVDVRLQLHAHARGVAIAAALGVAGLSVAVAFAVRRARRLSESRPRARWALLRRMWRRPEQLARPPRAPFFTELARRVALGALTALATGLVRHALARSAPRLRG